MFLEGSLRCGCIAENVYHISVIHAAGSEQKKLGCMLLCFMFKYINKCAACYFHCGFSHYQEQDFFFHEPTKISPCNPLSVFFFFFEDVRQVIAPINPSPSEKNVFRWKIC